MKETLAFLSENWGTIATVLVILVQILNAATRHWKDHVGVVRILTFLSEIFSIVTSKGQVNGLMGRVKGPFTSINNDDLTEEEEKESK